MFHRSRIALAAGGLALLAGGAFHVASVTAAVQHAGGPSLPGFHLGTSQPRMDHAWLAYYDGHQDTYLNTDVSDKSQASSLGVNFAPVLAHTLSTSSPMYFVKGPAAHGQIAVFGSEPGESDYSPLWREIWVTWKSGVKPVLLVRDDQINSLAKAGKLTEQTTTVVLNAPVTSVGH